jgi:uncharacterized membrane protein YeaQ/YmgE (transglycosylase-associated protein family)
MMSLLGTLFIGLIVGFIARAVKPGDDKLGWIMTALLGIAGSFVANYVGAALGLYKGGDARRVHCVGDRRSGFAVHLRPDQRQINLIPATHAFCD